MIIENRFEVTDEGGGWVEVLRDIIPPFILSQTTARPFRNSSSRNHLTNDIDYSLFASKSIRRVLLRVFFVEIPRVIRKVD